MLALQRLLKDLVLNDFQIEELYKRFGRDICNALQRNTQDSADMKCYNTFVCDLPTGHEKGNYLVLEISNSNIRPMLFKFHGNNTYRAESDIYKIPQSVMVGKGDGLFDLIAECLKKFLSKQGLHEGEHTLAMVFSFPCVHNSVVESILLRWTKGFNCLNVVNENVGRLLTEAIARRGIENVTLVAVVNDTTGTLVSCAYSHADCRIAVVIGRGTNACYVERTELTDSQLKKKINVVLNTEWGAFGDSGKLEFIRTEYDKQIDEKDLQTGVHVFEKMISGLYLGELVRLILIKALHNNIVFSKEANVSNILKYLSTNEYCIKTSNVASILDDNSNHMQFTTNFLKEKFNVEQPKIDDCLSIKTICETVVKRSATLVAIGTSVLVNKVCQPRVSVAIGGSVYTGFANYDRFIRETMHKYVKPNIKYSLIPINDSAGHGAALVAAHATRR